MELAALVGIAQFNCSILLNSLRPQKNYFSFLSLNLDKIGAMRVAFFFFFFRTLAAMFQPGENTSHSYEPLQRWYTAQKKRGDGGGELL